MNSTKRRVALKFKVWFLFLVATYAHAKPAVSDRFVLRGTIAVDEGKSKCKSIALLYDVTAAKNLIVRCGQALPSSEAPLVTGINAQQLTAQAGGSMLLVLPNKFLLEETSGKRENANSAEEEFDSNNYVETFDGVHASLYEPSGEPWYQHPVKNREPLP